MVCRVPGCLGDYDFDEIVGFARKRFLEGCDTVSLLQQAETQCEKEEIALVSLLSVDDDPAGTRVMLGDGLPGPPENNVAKRTRGGLRATGDSRGVAGVRRPIALPNNSLL